LTRESQNNAGNENSTAKLTTGETHSPPEKFIIDLKAAKQIGLTIPSNVLARADRVIK